MIGDGALDQEEAAQMKTFKIREAADSLMEGAEGDSGIWRRKVVDVVVSYVEMLYGLALLRMVFQPRHEQECVGSAGAGELDVCAALGQDGGHGCLSSQGSGLGTSGAFKSKLFRGNLRRGRLCQSSSAVIYCEDSQHAWQKRGMYLEH